MNARRRQSQDGDQYKIQLPRELDARIRAVAEREETTPDEVVLRILKAGLDREATDRDRPRPDQTPRSC
jgi:hypothetical protein